MTQTSAEYATPEAYLQLDAAGRAPVFAKIVRFLTELGASGGQAEAWSWARRAVSPLLGFPSLMKLRRFMPAGGSVGAAGDLQRLAIVGGPTTVQLRQAIEVFLAADGIPMQIYEAGFGLYRQEILTAGSGLDRFRPHIVFIATGARDVARIPAAGMAADEVAAMAEAEVADRVSIWEAANRKWSATVIQNNFEIDPASVFGHYALRHPSSRKHYFERLNRMLAERAPGNVFLHDLCGLAAEAGARDWFDPRFYLEFKLPCGPSCLVAYAYSVFSLLRAARGRSKKVLAVDLDNTLWGGVVGDVGAGGICFGQGSGEGEAYLSFQAYLKELRERGILLAVCSKNDPEKAREPFENRPDMILRLEDVSCFIANWENKADNLRTISARLGLPLESFVFVDDNPAERALVRSFLPEVAVPDMPSDPAGFVQALSVHRFFETTSFTGEDASRARYYAENARRNELIEGAADIDSFLRSLGMRINVTPVSELNIERVTQLVNKSNQFNLTTRRYTVAQIREIINDASWETFAFSLRDKLGDNGLISVVLMRKADGQMVVDTWVMSCRVLQRGVERFVRNEIVDLAAARGCALVVGEYVPTAKNGMVRDHYRALGFELASAKGESTFWSLSVDAAGSRLASHILKE